MLVFTPFLRAVVCALALFAATAAASVLPAAAAEVNLYTDRQAVFLKPVLAAFEQESGIQANVLFAKKGLLERMVAEGANSPADVVLVVDSARLQDYQDAGVLARYADPAIAAAVPDGYATPYWVAVTRRARILFVAADSTLAVRTYADLAAPRHRGKVCLRSGTHTYNIALFADMISRLGEEKGRAWLAGVKDNLARKPQGKDRTQIEDVGTGVCGIGVANSYYYFQMAGNADTQHKVANVRVVIPPQAHLNITGAALAAHAPHRDNALALMRFLVSKRAQEIYANENNEFPVRADAALPQVMAPFQQALENAAPPADIARYRRAASRMVEDLGFNR